MNILKRRSGTCRLGENRASSQNDFAAHPVPRDDKLESPPVRSGWTHYAGKFIGSPAGHSRYRRDGPSARSQRACGCRPGGDDILHAVFQLQLSAHEHNWPDRPGGWQRRRRRGPHCSVSWRPDCNRIGDYHDGLSRSHRPIWARQQPS